MAVAGATGPVMSREEVDRTLARLTADHEALESALLALGEHAVCRRLAAGGLRGRTRERWSAAEPAVAALRRHLEVLAGALAAARAVRARHRWPNASDLAELTDLLRGRGVRLPADPPPQAAGGPAGPAPAAERIGLEELVERMTACHGRVMEVVSAAEAVWSALPARLAALAAETERVRSLAVSVGVLPGEHPAGDALEALTAELADLHGEVPADPLAFWLPARSRESAGRPDVRRYQRAERELEDVRREVEAVLHVRDDAEHRLLGVRDVLSRTDRTLAEARTARGEVLARIAAVEVPPVGNPAAALREDLALAVEYRRFGRWHLLSPLLDSLEQRADEELQRARASLSAVTAPLAIRAELRSRLDAYKANAARHGAADDPLLVERYDQARRLLWSAPCDLRAAQHAVARYRQAITEVLVPLDPREGGRP